MTYDVLLTGGSGQVGTDLRRIAPAHWRVFAPSSGQLDLADPASIREKFASRAWSLVVSAGAYTAVDQAEDEIEQAWRVNALGPAVLAGCCAAAGVPIIHVSTDYVFDGSKGGWYEEDDRIAPLGVYGASKAGGELAVRTATPLHVILRTAWVISGNGKNFVKTMIRLAETQTTIRVVSDQIGCPTSASDIAECLVEVGRRFLEQDRVRTGTFHMANQGQGSWFDVAQATMLELEHAGLAIAEVLPISTSEYPTRARRPSNSRLSTVKLAKEFGIELPPWRGAVADVVKQILNPNKREESI